MSDLKTLLISGAVLLSIFMLPQKSCAQWQKQDEAAAHFEDFQIVVRVNRDYSVEVTEEFTAVIDKKAAIKDFSTIESTYVPEIGQFKILAAKVIDNGKTEILNPRLAQDKAVDSKQAGYDTLREVRFSLPQVTIGSKVYVKLWRKALPHPFPNFVSEMVKFDEQFPVRSYQFKMDSAVPIAYKLFDPRHQLSIQESKTAGGMHLETKSTGTIFQRVKNEPFSVFPEP